MITTIAQNGRVMPGVDPLDALDPEAAQLITTEPPTNLWTNEDGVTCRTWYRPDLYVTHTAHPTDVQVWTSAYTSRNPDGTAVWIATVITSVPGTAPSIIREKYPIAGE